MAYGATSAAKARTPLMQHWRLQLAWCAFPHSFQLGCTPRSQEHLEAATQGHCSDQCISAGLSTVRSAGEPEFHARTSCYDTDI